MGIRFNARTNSIETDAASVDFTQPITTPASTTSLAGLNIAEAVAAPTAPVDGDVWVTAGGAFNVRLNGVTVDLAAGGGVTASGTPVDSQLAVWTGASDIEGDANLTWNGTSQYLSIGSDGGRIARTGASSMAFQTDTGTAWMTYTAGVLLVQNTTRMDGGNILKFYGTSASPRINVYADNASGALVIDNESGFNKVSVEKPIEIGALLQADTVSVSGDYAAIVAKQNSGTSNTSLMEQSDSGVLMGLANYAEVIYSFNNPTTSADPGTGFFRVNNASFASATELYVDDNDLSNQDQAWFWSMLNVGDILMLHQTSDRTKWLHAEVSSITDNTGWYTIGISPIESSGTVFTNAASVGFIVKRATETFGGTGQTTYATGDILYASGANTLSKLAAGTDTHVLTLSGGVPTWSAAAGGGNVSNTGTPVNNQLAIWTDATTIEGDASLTFDSATNILTLYDTADTDSIVMQVSTNTFDIEGSGLNSIRIQPTAGQQAIVANASGSVVLYHSGTQTFQTNINRSESLNAITSNSGGVERVLTVGDIEAGQPRLRYFFDATTTSGDPGSGQIRYNNATPASVTSLYINDTSDSGLNSDRVLNNLASGDILTLCDEEDGADYLVVSVNGAPTDNTGWWTIPVTVIHSGTLPTNVVNIDVQWFSQAGGGGNVSNTGTPVNNQLAIWTDATTIEGDAKVTFDGSSFAAYGDGTAPDNHYLGLDSGNRMRIECGTNYGMVMYEDDNVSTEDSFLYIGNTTSSTGNQNILFRKNGGDWAHFEYYGSEARFEFTGPLEITGTTNYVGDAGLGTTISADKIQVWAKSRSLDHEPMVTTGDNDLNHTFANVLEVCYHFDQTTTAADPGAGNLRWNNATPGSVTNWYIDDLESTGKDASFMLANLEIGDEVYLRSQQDANEYMIARVSSAPTDNTGYWTIPVTVLDSSTLPGTGDPVHIGFTKRSSALYSGTVTRFVADASGEATIRRDDSSDTSVCRLSFAHANAVDRGWFGFNGSSTMNWNNEVHGGGFSITGETAGGSAQNIFSATPGDNDTIVYSNGTAALIVQSDRIIADSLALDVISAAPADTTGEIQIWGLDDPWSGAPMCTLENGDDYALAFANARIAATNAAFDMNTSSNGHLAVNGMCFYDNTTAYTITLENSGSNNFRINATMQVLVVGTGTITINEGTSTTLWLVEAGTVTDTAGGCTMGEGVATIFRSATGTYYIWGSGITA